MPAARSGRRSSASSFEPRTITRVYRGRHRIVFESFGLIAEVVSDDQRVFDSLPSALPPGWRPESGRAVAQFGLTREGVVTLDETEVPHHEGDRRAPLARLAAVVRHHIAEHAPRHVFIHAGVVAVAGSAVVIPGSSRSGKTTLVGELVRAGAQYYSDEYAVVDPEGLIQPFAKPLSVRAAGAQELGVPIPAAQTGSQPIQAGLIVITSYEPEADWVPTVLTPGEGAFALLRHTVAARSRPRDALLAVTALSRDARVISGSRGEASDTAREVFATAVDAEAAPR